MDTKQLLEAAETIQLLRNLILSPERDWLPVFAAVAGALAGGVATFIPSFLLERYRLRTESRNITNALVAEVSAILGIIERRRYVEEIKEGIARLMAGGEQSLAISVNIPPHYSRVYQSNVGRLGAVPTKLAVQVVEFHQLLEAAVQDVTPGGVLSNGEGGLEGWVQLLEITEAAIDVGTKIVEAKHDVESGASV